MLLEFPAVALLAAVAVGMGIVLAFAAAASQPSDRPARRGRWSPPPVALTWPGWVPSRPRTLQAPGAAPPALRQRVTDSPTP